MKDRNLGWFAALALSLYVIVLLLISGCSTIQQNKSTVSTLAKSAATVAGLYSYQRMPMQYRLVVDNVCLAKACISPEADPAVVQAEIKEILGQVWVQAGDAGVVLIQTALNSFVALSGLNSDNPTAERVREWLELLDAYCAGVESAKASAEISSFFEPTDTRLADRSCAGPWVGLCRL